VISTVNFIFSKASTTQPAYLINPTKYILCCELLDFISFVSPAR